MIMTYKLTSIPDISLSKYQVIAINGIESLKEWTDDFLRQWQKISAIYEIEINYIIRYTSANKKGNKLECYIVFKFEDRALVEYLSNLMGSSKLMELYKITFQEENPFKGDVFKEKFILKKCERKRCCEIGDNDKSVDLFYVESWETNKDSRLIDLVKTMEMFDTDVMYRVVLRGADSYEDVYSSLEKPIEYLKNKSFYDSENTIKLNKDARVTNNKDAFSGEILKVYEKFLSSISNAPCFKGNVIVYSNDEILGNMILSTLCGETIKKGNWESSIFKEDSFGVIDDYVELHNIMPKSLNYWPTYYTLDEIKSFFRFPILYEGEHIELRKETDPVESDGEIYLGKNLQDINIPLNLLKKHAFVCGVPGAGKTNTMLDELLDVFLSRTSEWLRIDTSQYSILQKVFGYSEAYEQEKKVLEAMVEKCIPRTQEQERRLSFLQTSNVKNGYLQEESIKQDEIFQEGSCMYEYRSVHWDVHKIDEFFESLSLRNTTVEYPFVVREWNKDVNIKNVEVDITELVIRMQNVFKESFNDRFDVGITNIKTLDNYADYVEAVLIDETDLDTGYSWILFFVTGERKNNKQVAFSIYTLYIPLLDTDVIALENNIIEKNKVCAQKIKLLKEMQNPRINRHIQNVNDLIISVLEKWSNEEKEHIDIYG